MMRTDFAASQLGTALAPSSQAPAAARRFVHMVSAPAPETARERAELVASELINNALRHRPGQADSLIGVRVTVEPERIRIEVTDPTFEQAPAIFSADSDTQVGLDLMEEYADRWGIVLDDPPAVWAEIDLAPRSIP